MRQWRLITDSPMAGAWNMAYDEAILSAVSAGEQVPTLRLYAWTPLCLSLGYGQPARDADTARLAERAWHLVRRPTGGRAILHGDELTYSIALPIHHELAQGDVIESYRRISQGLLLSLQQLGLHPQSERNAALPSEFSPICFEVPSHYEITVAGKKLIGSAQVRRKDGILQHGSLPLYGDLTRICDALAYPDEAQRQTARQAVLEHATTLASVLGKQISHEQAQDAFIAGFSHTFDIELVLQTLSSAEQAQAEQLIHSHYANPEWTYKR